jgi:hypothetical protein
MAARPRPSSYALGTLGMMLPHSPLTVMRWSTLLSSPDTHARTQADALKPGGCLLALPISSYALPSTPGMMLPHPPLTAEMRGCGWSTSSPALDTHTRAHK